MATMTLAIGLALIENSGEQCLYEPTCELPTLQHYYYRYKFSAGEYAANPDVIFEADFIIVHSCLGYLVVKVKDGQYQYFNNCWRK